MLDDPFLGGRAAQQITGTSVHVYSSHLPQVAQLWQRKHDRHTPDNLLASDGLFGITCNQPSA